MNAHQQHVQMHQQAVNQHQQHQQQAVQQHQMQQQQAYVQRMHMHQGPRAGTTPTNSIDICADMTDASTFYYTPMVATFETMALPASMPPALAPYMTREEYAGKMQEMNECIEKMRGVWKRRKYCGLALFATIVLAITFQVPGHFGKNKIRKRLIRDAKRIFADWANKGLGVMFLPGQSMSLLEYSPNTIRIVFPQ